MSTSERDHTVPGAFTSREDSLAENALQELDEPSGEADKVPDIACQLCISKHTRHRFPLRAHRGL